jgi:hypothetical protein
MAEPIRIQINAVDPSGKPFQAEVDLSSRSIKRFALTPIGQPPRTVLAPTAEASLTDWEHPDVGWGVIMSSTRRIPKSLADLIAKRKANVFRFTPDWDRRFTYFRNEALGRDVAIAGSPRGMGPGRLPHYLLIIGPPTEVPWSVQFALAATRAVGRIPLDGPQLDNYIQALLTDFSGSDAAAPYSSVTWSSHVSDTDITGLMRTFIAAKVQQKLEGDDEIGVARALFLDGKTNPEAATITRLYDELERRKPGLIVTTSHGLTGPLDKVDTMKATLGVPVDQKNVALDPESLLKKWSPAGAVWYCHACCSAGSDSPSAFANLFDEGADLRNTLNAIAETGPMVAPLPMRLLGHARPVRAFIGHVEPTFDWTLRNPGNGQVLTATLVKAIYPNLFQTKPFTPIGQAFRDVHADIGGYLSTWEAAREQYDAGAKNLTDLLTWQLCARDLQSLVILGDPAAALPLRNSTGVARPAAVPEVLGT